MPLEFAPPRYAQLVAALRSRMESGEYPPGTMLPSEHQLVRDFGVSRATVVRALQVLRQEGWVDSQQGKGTFVRSRPAGLGDRPRRGQAALDREEPAARVLHAGPAAAPARVAGQLGLEAGSQAVLRRRLLTVGGEPAELSSAWFPPEIAAGTELASGEPLREGIREHLRARRGVRLDHMVERISARMPTAEEARTLGMPRRVPVLDILVTAFDSSARPVQVVELVLPADRHELEDSYTVS
jgi:GntR family transcriptional regulator